MLKTGLVDVVAEHLNKNKFIKNGTFLMMVNKKSTTKVVHCKAFLTIKHLMLTVCKKVALGPSAKSRVPNCKKREHKFVSKVSLDYVCWVGSQNYIV